MRNNEFLVVIFNVTIVIHNPTWISKVQNNEGWLYTFWKMSKCDKNAIQKVDMINKYQMSD